MPGTDPPGALEVLSHFTFDAPWMAAAGLAAFLYVRGYFACRDCGRTSCHPGWRLAAFLAGIVLVLVSVLSPLEYYGNRLLWADFLGFLVLTMAAAPLLVIGAPVTLAFRTLGAPGRRRLRRTIRSAPFAVITFPIATWLAFAVVTYAWQFSALTDLAARDAPVRDVQLLSLLVVSLLFWAPAIQADPLRWHPGHPGRALYVFVEMTHKGLFGGMFLSMSHTFHDRMARDLPPWAPSPIMDQRIAIVILWIGGNLVFVAALVFIILGWIRYEARHARRVDARLARAREAKRRREAALQQVFQKTI
ncbi:MAG: cytochrome c oxidase assembly protein [Dehalococcoidia bacterium]|nr:cytochrome c oxidase assembly protein [Dehalococcoidia bacterium]